MPRAKATTKTPKTPREPTSKAPTPSPPSAALPRRRVGFSRSQLFIVSQLVQDATESGLLGKGYRKGRSDETVAMAANERLDRSDITPDDIKRLRWQVFGKFPDEKTSTKEDVKNLHRIIAELSKKMSELEARIVELEEDYTEPEERGAVVTRTNGFADRR